MSSLADHALTHLPTRRCAAGCAGGTAEDGRGSMRDRRSQARAGSISASSPATSVSQPADIWSWIGALCRPAATLSSDLSSFILVFAMWVAMTLAMMLPSAAPMILTYAEIADTAARKGEHVVSPIVLALGYAAIWIGFALLAAAMQIALAKSGIDCESASGAASGVSGILFARRGSLSILVAQAIVPARLPAAVSVLLHELAHDRRAACSASACGRGCIASAAAGR